MWWNDFPVVANRVIWWLMDHGEVRRGWRGVCARDLGVAVMSVYRAEKVLFDAGVVSRIKRGSKVKLVKKAFDRPKDLKGVEK